MKQVSAIKNKICAVLLIAILTVCCIPFPALASETTLTTTVPSQVSVKLEIEGNGKIEVNGKSYTENTTIEVDRHTKTEFCLIPNFDYELKAILYNDENVFSELRDSIFTLQEIENDSVLKVTFTPKNASPETGDSSFPLWIYAILMIISVAGIVFAVKKKYDMK